MDLQRHRVQGTVTMKRYVCLLLILLAPKITLATVALTGGEWSTTFNCTGYQQDTGTQNDNVCDGVEENGNFPYTCESSLSETSVAGNYSGGGGGSGFRMRMCSGVNTQTSGPLMEFSPGINEFWMRWYMRFGPGLSFSSLEYIKILSWGGAYGQGGPNLYMNMQSGRMADFYANETLWHNQTYDTGCEANCNIADDLPEFTFSDIMGNPSDGSWHYYEVHLKPDTNGVDGIAEMWVDNVLRNRHTGIGVGANKSTVWLSWFINQSTIGTGGWVDVDDIAISTNGYIGPLGSSDTTPSAFSFADQTGVALGSTNNSDNQAVTGIDNETTLALTGDASCKYSINGAAWATADDNVALNDNVALQNVASGSYSTAISCTLNLGGVTDVFSRTTLAASAAAVPQRFRGGSMGSRN
ncbi:MAG: hypothetical protein WA058_02095 [Minisyncoccia bacterium]